MPSTTTLWHTKSSLAAAQQLNVEPKQGMTAAEAARRQFPESHGYAFGPFNSVGASRVESAA